MLSTNAFDYVNVLDKAADASWKRESLISNNIANVDTPGYKRQDLDFQSALKLELSRSNHDSLDSRVGQMDLTKLNPMTFTDMAGYSYRLDGNNWMGIMWILIRKMWSLLRNRFVIRL